MTENTKEKASLLETLRKNKSLVSDGAWGTMLYKAGLKSGECPENWNLTHPEAVKKIAEAYLTAGANIVGTNSFGGTRIKLKYYGLADQCSAINEAAAGLSREAGKGDHYVIGSMGPTGKMLVMGNISADELYNAFKEQAIALEKGGAHALCVETMSDIEEARLAVQACREHTECTVICTFTFDKTARKEYRSMMGVDPVSAAEAMLKAGAQIVGTNCGNGFAGMIEIIREMRNAFPDTPLLVHANAGLPINKEGTILYPDTPEDMARFVPDLLKAGANIIGGCCGTTPEHIKAIAKSLSALT